MHETASTASRYVTTSAVVGLPPAAMASRRERVIPLQFKTVRPMRERPSFGDSLSAMDTVRSKSSEGAKKSTSPALQCSDGAPGGAVRFVGGFQIKETRPPTLTEVNSRFGSRLSHSEACRNREISSALCSLTLPVALQRCGSAEHVEAVLRQAPTGLEQAGSGDLLQQVTGPSERSLECIETMLGMLCGNRDNSVRQISSGKDSFEPAAAGNTRGGLTYRSTLSTAGTHSMAFTFAPSGSSACSVRLTYAPDGLLTIHISGVWYSGRERLLQKKELEQALRQIGFEQILVLPGVLESQS